MRSCASHAPYVSQQLLVKDFLQTQMLFKVLKSLGGSFCCRVGPDSIYIRSIFLLFCAKISKCAGYICMYRTGLVLLFQVFPVNCHLFTKDKSALMCLCPCLIGGVPHCSGYTDSYW